MIPFWKSSKLFNTFMTITLLFLQFKKKFSFPSWLLGDIYLSLQSNNLTRVKRRRSEDKAQFTDVVQLFFQLLEYIDRKTRCGDSHLGAGAQSGRHIVFQRLIYVVYKFHINKMRTPKQHLKADQSLQRLRGCSQSFRLSPYVFVLMNGHFQISVTYQLQSYNISVKVWLSGINKF